MDLSTAYEVVRSYMPITIAQAMQRVVPKQICKVNEIRVRVNKPLCFYFCDKVRFLNADGSLTDNFKNDQAIIITRNDIDGIVKALCRFSVHSCIREFSQGFFTIEKGIRVGIAGTLAYSSEHTIKHINALNFRIPRQMTGCAEPLFSQIFFNGRKNVLICGGVNSGKTTLLRDICRLCGDKYKVVLIDERNEIAASVNGIPTNDVGIQTDVLDGYSRAEGIISAIRTLSPHLIICDEISGDEDSAAILQGLGCGTNFVAAVHAVAFADLRNKPATRRLIEDGVFDYAVFLSGESFPGKIREIRRLKSNA